MQKSQSLPLGVVVRKAPGVTRWAGWSWRAAAVLPGAGPADWTELRREGEAVEYHAATLPLTLYRTDTEAYATELAVRSPSVYVVLRKDAEGRMGVHAVTVSPYEGQDYCDNGEDIVERVPMPPGLLAWVAEFVATHHREETFVKRRRDKVRIDRKEDGIGDARVRQMADVYRAPGSLRDGEDR